MVYIIEENIDRMGGVERIVSLLANHFSKKQSVTVVSLYKNEIPFFKYDTNVKREYLSSIELNKKNYSNKVKYFLLLRKIKDFCKHINDNDTLIFGRVPIAIKFMFFIKKHPTIIVRDAINLYDYSSFLKSMIKHFFPKKVNYFVVSSNESLRLYENFFKTSNIDYKIIYNPIGINYEGFNYNHSKKIIISNGRFDYQKGFNVLLEACKMVFYKHNDWKLLLFGDGPLKVEYQEFIDKNNLNNNIIINSSSNNIENELKKASIYVMTSRYEGYANSLVEAMAVGLPSISFDWLTGVDEIIKNDYNGIIVNLDNRINYFYGKDNIINAKNLADAICNLIEDETCCKKISINAKKIIESRNNDIIFKRWEEMINESDNANNKTTL